MRGRVFHRLRTRGRRDLVGLGIFLALTVAAVSIGPLSTAPASKPKQRSVFWGAWLGDQLTGTEAPYDMGAVEKFERIVGKSLSLVEFAFPLAHCGSSGCTFVSFPREQTAKVRSHGAIPFLSWNTASDPHDPSRPGTQPDFQLSDVISGRYDSEIRHFAAGAADWGRPFFLRFNWEMNGSWFPWGVGANGNRPEEFVAAWRRVHDIFVAAGATNATWVWCPYVDLTGKQNLKALYPGSKYVDWTCLDGYNWGPGSPANPRPWRSFDEIFSSTYRRVVKRIAPRKPLMIGEVASSPYGGSKAAWIRNMLRVIPERYPRVRGVIWFDVDDRGAGWPIEVSPPAITAFRKGISNPVYMPNIFGDITVHPIPPPG